MAGIVASLGLLCPPAAAQVQPWSESAAVASPTPASSLVCWAIVDPAAGELSRAEYRQWVDQEVLRLQALLPECAAAGARVVVELGTPPGGIYPSGEHAGEARLFHEAEWAAEFLSIWKRVPRRLAAEPAVWGFNLLHEPAAARDADARARWRELATFAAQRVNHYAPWAAVVVEPILGAPAEMHPAWFAPLDGVWNAYYGPSLDSFLRDDSGATHSAFAATSGTYRPVVSGLLQATREFQSAYGAGIFVRQFVPQDLPVEGALRSRLWDSLRVIENAGWNAMYHGPRRTELPLSGHDAGRMDSARNGTPQAGARPLHSWFDRALAPGS